MLEAGHKHVEAEYDADQQVGGLSGYTMMFWVKNKYERCEAAI